MEGGFQKSPQLFVANGCCVFEDNFYVNLSSVLDGKPNYAKVPLQSSSLGLASIRHRS